MAFDDKYAISLQKRKDWLFFFAHTLEWVAVHFVIHKPPCITIPFDP